MYEYHQDESWNYACGSSWSSERIYRRSQLRGELPPLSTGTLQCLGGCLDGVANRARTTPSDSALPRVWNHESHGGLERASDCGCAGHERCPLRPAPSCQQHNARTQSARDPLECVGFGCSAKHIAEGPVLGTTRG